MYFVISRQSSKIGSTLNNIHVSMLKMLTLMPETFCQFSKLSEELQSFNCMQNDRVIKAKLFCQKHLSIQSTM
jgi:S-adenosylmethionine:tRNA-ribosyltransferase-isomerase (queuine synthetase)